MHSEHSAPSHRLITRPFTYSSEAADGIIVAADCRLDGLNIFSEGQLLNVIQPDSLRPVTSVKKSDVAVDIIKAVFNDRKQL